MNSAAHPSTFCEASRMGRRWLAIIACAVWVCAVGSAAELSDGWQGRPVSGGRLVSVSFADDRHGWASGIGALLHSDDGGATWRQQWDARRDGSYWFNNVVALDRQVAMVSAFAYGRDAPGLLLRTSDGGATWKALEIGASGPTAYTSLTFAADHRTGLTR